MLRILFVDDEPLVLRALQTALRRERHRWDMHFATGGEEALAAWDAAPFDVIVSDMRMPGMDGAALLEQIRRRSDTAVCLLLTGYSDERSLARVRDLCDRILGKPCPSSELIAALDETTTGSADA